MKKIFLFLNNVFSAIFEQIAGIEHHWHYEPDKRYFDFSGKCRAQMKALGLHEAYARDVYTNGLKFGDGFMVKKYNGYQVTVRYWITPESGKVVITWIEKKEIRN